MNAKKSGEVTSNGSPIAGWPFTNDCVRAFHAKSLLEPLSLNKILKQRSLNVVRSSSIARHFVEAHSRSSWAGEEGDHFDSWQRRAKQQTSRCILVPSESEPGEQYSSTRRPLPSHDRHFVIGCCKRSPPDSTCCPHPKLAAKTLSSTTLLTYTARSTANYESSQTRHPLHGLHILGLTPLTSTPYPSEHIARISAAPRKTS